MCDAGDSAGGVELDVVAVLADEIRRSMPEKVPSVCADGDGMVGDVGENCPLFPMSGAMYMELFNCCWYAAALGNDSLKSLLTSLYLAIDAMAAWVVM